MEEAEKFEEYEKRAEEFLNYLRVSPTRHGEKIGEAEPFVVQIVSGDAVLSELDLTKPRDIYNILPLWETKSLQPLDPVEKVLLYLHNLYQGTLFDPDDVEILKEYIERGEEIPLDVFEKILKKHKKKLKELPTPIKKLVSSHSNKILQALYTQKDPEKAIEKLKFSQKEIKKVVSALKEFQGKTEQITPEGDVFSRIEAFLKKEFKPSQKIFQFPQLSLQHINRIKTAVEILYPEIPSDKLSSTLSKFLDEISSKSIPYWEIDENTVLFPYVKNLEPPDDKIVSNLFGLFLKDQPQFRTKQVFVLPIHYQNVLKYKGEELAMKTKGKAKRLFFVASENPTVVDDLIKFNQYFQQLGLAPDLNKLKYEKFDELYELMLKGNIPYTDVYIQKLLLATHLLNPAITTPDDLTDINKGSVAIVRYEPQEGVRITPAGTGWKRVPITEMSSGGTPPAILQGSQSLFPFQTGRITPFTRTPPAVIIDAKWRLVSKSDFLGKLKKYGIPIAVGGIIAYLIGRGLLSHKNRNAEVILNSLQQDIEEKGNNPYGYFADLFWGLYQQARSQALSGYEKIRQEVANAMLLEQLAHTTYLQQFEIDPLTSNSLKFYTMMMYPDEFTDIYPKILKGYLASKIRNIPVANPEDYLALSSLKLDPPYEEAFANYYDAISFEVNKIKYLQQESLKFLSIAHDFLKQALKVEHENPQSPFNINLINPNEIDKKIQELKKEKEKIDDELINEATALQSEEEGMTDYYSSQFHEKTIGKGIRKIAQLFSND